MMLENFLRGQDHVKQERERKKDRKERKIKMKKKKESTCLQTTSILLLIYLSISFYLEALEGRSIEWYELYCCCQEQFNEIPYQIICKKFFGQKCATKESSLWLKKVIQANPMRWNRQLSYDVIVGSMCYFLALCFCLSLPHFPSFSLFILYAKSCRARLSIWTVE